MLSKRLMWIAWPAFLGACVLEALVFAMIDPDHLQWFGGALPLSREGFYTIAFFVFWGVTLAASALTTLLSVSPFEVNQCPLSPDARVDGCPK